MVPGPVLKEEKGLRSFLQEITIRLFLLGVAEKLCLRSISTFSLSLCCQPHTGQVLSSWLGLTSGAKTLSFGRVVWTCAKDHSLLWAQNAPLGIWTALTRILVFGRKVLHKLKTCKASEYNEEVGFKITLMLKSIVPLSFPQIAALRDKIFIPDCWQYVL